MTVSWICSLSRLASHRAFPTGPGGNRTVQDSVFPSGVRLVEVQKLIPSVIWDQPHPGMAGTGRGQVTTARPHALRPCCLTETLRMLGFDFTNEMEDHLAARCSPTSTGVPSYRLAFKIHFS